MAERRNGNASHRKQTHGSEWRSGVAIPRRPEHYQQQRPIKAPAYKLQEHIFKQFDIASLEKKAGYGNQSLPVYKHKADIIQTVEENKATILGGPTGSGKSTQVPQYLLEAGYDKVYMMVPRRIIADGLYERLIEELSEHLGVDEATRIVGVAHGERSEHSEDSRIMVMTPNTFARMEADIRAQYGTDKVAIISDEIHEANLYTEIATGIAAQAVDELDSWRLIAASATHNADALKESFRKINGRDVAPINIEGRPFTIDIQEAPDESPMEVYARMGDDHAKSMIFTSGKKEIDHIISEVNNVLESQEIGSSRKLIIRKLHGELNDIEMGHLNDPVPEDCRLLIVSSPAGMSGITIPGVTLVVTDGTINRQELDDDGIPGLSRRYLSNAEIIQQMGRAGRDIEGGVGVLACPTAVAEDRMLAEGKAIEVQQMPYEPLNARNQFGPPEIYHSNLSGVVLTVASLDRRFSGINPYIPNQVASSEIIKSEESLARIGALDDDDAVTAIGRKMSAYQVRPELSRGIVEAVNQGRTLQQLARIAYIASALETGGVQDFTVKDSTEWKKLLRPSTTDDVIAQLDLVMAEAPESQVENINYLERYDLSYKRMQRTKKVARKIMHTLGVRMENIVVAVPTPSEETELRHDLTAGMIDFVYEQSTEVGRVQYYQNIHGDESATQRFISNRSIVSQKKHQHVIGFPRWYNTAKRDGSTDRHDIIEQLMPADPVVVGRYAADNHLLGRKSESPIMEGRQVVEQFQPVFGSIKVGGLESGVFHDAIPVKSQNLLVHHVLQSPGDKQIALREIVNEIARYVKRYPAEYLQQFIRSDAPREFITSESIEAEIRRLAEHHRTAHEIDNGLGLFMYQKDVGIDRYFDADTRKMLTEGAPDEITVGGGVLRVHYDKSGPYVIPKGEEMISLLRQNPQYLTDGREVEVQLTSGDLGKIRISAANL